MNLPKKMLAAKLPTALLSDVRLLILATRERVARTVDSALRRELIWSSFKRLIYRAVQRIQIISITARDQRALARNGQPYTPARTMGLCPVFAPRFGASFISFRPLSFPVHAAVSVLLATAFWLPGVRVFFHHVFQCNRSLNAKLLTPASRQGSASRIIPCTEPGTTPGPSRPRC
jgi:hypothetical protein